MQKDPAFLFYYRDFAHGTRRMSFEEKGAYIELLCEQADTGHIALPDIKKIMQNRIELWEAIQGKFKKDENDCYYNEVLEGYMTKRKKYCESRRANIKKRYEATHVDTHEATHGSAMVGKTTLQVANANANANANEIVKDKKVVFRKPSIEEILEYIMHQKLGMDAQEFYDYYESNGWKVGRNAMKDWKASARNWARRDNKRKAPELTNAQKKTLNSWQRWKESTKDDPDEDRQE